MGVRNMVCMKQSLPAHGVGGEHDQEVRKCGDEQQVLVEVMTTSNAISARGECAGEPLLHVVATLTRDRGEDDHERDRHPVTVVEVEELRSHNATPAATPSTIARRSHANAGASGWGGRWPNFIARAIPRGRPARR